MRRKVTGGYQEVHGRPVWVEDRDEGVPETKKPPEPKPAPSFWSICPSCLKGFHRKPDNAEGNVCPHCGTEYHGL